MHLHVDRKRDIKSIKQRGRRPKGGLRMHPCSPSPDRVTKRHTVTPRRRCDSSSFPTPVAHTAQAGSTERSRQVRWGKGPNWTDLLLIPAPCQAVVAVLLVCYNTIKRPHLTPIGDVLRSTAHPQGHLCWHLFIAFEIQSSSAGKSTHLQALQDCHRLQAPSSTAPSCAWARASGYWLPEQSQAASELSIQARTATAGLSRFPVLVSILLGSILTPRCLRQLNAATFTQLRNTTDSDCLPATCEPRTQLPTTGNFL